ncbi:class I SAM-dependent methyltransferase [Pseudogemmatithrix spongiicola]|uniref:Class I SAM-dependent methyltransferase n=1 Tax=Pseudogemmatithrix spongiicola TaxID=3062599 RepID=A0AA49K0J7_9BACT|nr:class I SAM-dependent methyltransferase [Gemmatimonadaceae bacterium 'strain 138']WKW15381.1 class I SAM-dependent methyltransferase [Gemmatimonadaceae bacterium 'strain 318']
MSSDPVWMPQVAADAEGLATWRRAPNYRRTSDRRRVFVHAVRESLAEAARAGGPVRALDIGCGWGISDDRVAGPEFLAGVRAAATELWGIEPDPSVQPTHGHFDRFQHATLEGAELPEAYFDVAYAYNVVEHVTDPVAFLRRVRAVLKPGGAFVFMTPNGRHWFSRLTRALRALKVDELALRAARGRAEVESYHYPVVHRMNDVATIRDLAHGTGFAEAEFAFFDHGDVLPYFPRPLRAPYAALARLSRRVATGELVCLLGRLR